MIILRTNPEHISEVVRHSKHALNKKPSLTRGDTILISQISENTIFGYKECKNPIQYVMEFERLYLDTSGKSKQIWGIQYKYIIEGSNCRPLKRPFDIRKYQVTNKEYGPGGPFVYVEQEDEKAIQQHGLLETV